jgi:hypothetical protein
MEEAIACHSSWRWCGLILVLHRSHWLVIARSLNVPTDSPFVAGLPHPQPDGAAFRIKKRLREKSKFARHFKADSAVQSLAQKYIASVFQNNRHAAAIPPRCKRDVLANRHRT